MKVTDQQFQAACEAYKMLSPISWDSDALRFAIGSIPEPLPRLRPLSELPAEVPEGAVRLIGFQDVLGSLHMSDNQKYHKRLFLDVLPPLPEPAKPDSLQDELVTALQMLCDSLSPQDMHNGNRDQYNAARAAIAKAKGGQP